MSKLSLEMQSYSRYSDKKRGFRACSPFSNPIKIQFICIKKKLNKKRERTGNKTK